MTLNNGFGCNSCFTIGVLLRQEENRVIEDGEWKGEPPSSNESYVVWTADDATVLFVQVGNRYERAESAASNTPAIRDTPSDHVIVRLASGEEVFVRYDTEVLWLWDYTF